jgi:zinc protease
VRASELMRAQNMIVTQIIYLRDSALGVVNAIGESESVADWKLYVDLPKQVEEVTAEDLRRVVHAYFTDDNRTVGYFIPRDTA